MSEKAREFFVGIDISKNTLDVCIEPQGSVCNVAYDEAGMAQLAQRLLEIAPTLIVMEATGGLEMRLAAQLAVQGCRRLLSSSPGARFCPCERPLAKTDRVDAACWRPLAWPCARRCARCGRRHARPERSAHPAPSIDRHARSRVAPPGPGRLEGACKRTSRPHRLAGQANRRLDDRSGPAPAKLRTVASQGRSDARVPGVGR